MYIICLIEKKWLSIPAGGDSLYSLFKTNTKTADIQIVPIFLDKFWMNTSKVGQYT